MSTIHASTTYYPLSLHDALPIFVTASADKTARVWDRASRKEIAVLRGHLDNVISATFSRDGRLIITASEDKTARSEEHTSELQSLTNLVCRLLLEKKN